eukprot:COSAG02_NODE_24960_length_673_cov_0.670732_1_plen_28_part_10
MTVLTEVANLLPDGPDSAEPVFDERHGA